jgi:uroporphyrinogen decarboxylase
MSVTSRELVLQTLNFEGPARAPRDLWLLPWASKRYPEELKRIQQEFPADIGFAPGYPVEAPRTKGDPTAVGEFTDEWGCTFANLQEGVIGEVKDNLVEDWNTDHAKIHVPREWFTIQPDKINAFCAESDRFLLAGFGPNPFERLQFLRGTVNLYIDLLDQPEGMLAFIKEMQAFYCEVLERWAATDVDAFVFSDDWGSQQNLLIDPEQWRTYFKPLYRDYIEIAHSAGKKCFMHSDGHILAIFPDLVELGLDAVNSQLFCMGIDNLEPFAGKITFWGEVDRQHILPEGTLDTVDRAVREVHSKLWKDGGCIAQCEFGAGAKPENVRQVFATWDALTRQASEASVG